MENETVWGNIQDKKFLRACELADIEYKQTKSLNRYFNKVFALLNLNLKQEAYNHLLFIKESNSGQSEAEFEYIGLIHWFNNEKNEAVDSWIESENAIYKDAAGGVFVQCLLYYASLVIQDLELKRTTVKKLKTLLKKKVNINFPGSLGSYLLDQISDIELLDSASDVPRLKERHLCDIYFVQAIKALEKNNKDLMIQKFKDIVEFDNKAYLQKSYYLAKFEIETC